MSEIIFEDIVPIILDNQESLMAVFGQQLDAARQAVLCLPLGHPYREHAIANIELLWYTHIALFETLNDATTKVVAANAGLSEALSQRDALAAELAGLLAHLGWDEDDTY